MNIPELTNYDFFSHIFSSVRLEMQASRNAKVKLTL